MNGQKHNKSVNVSLVFSPLTQQEIFKICKKWEDCRLTIHCSQSLVKWKLSTKTSREFLICRPASQLDDRQQTTKVLSFFFFLRAHAGALTFELVGGGFLTDPCGSLLLLRVHSGEGTGGGGVPPSLTCPTVPGVSLSLNVVGVGGKRLLGLGGRKDRINEGDTRCPGVGWHGVPCLCLGLEALLWLRLWVTVSVCFFTFKFLQCPNLETTCYSEEFLEVNRHRSSQQWVELKVMEELEWMSPGVILLHALLWQPIFFVPIPTFKKQLRQARAST